ncbi:MAG TPA: DUF2007 domain-containing protein [Gemmatimonadales bacterium]|jgi:hypothetical protein
MSDSEWVVVANYGDSVEADLAAGRLESCGIPARVDRHDAVGIFGPGHSGMSVRGVDVRVPADRLQAAREALDLTE